MPESYLGQGLIFEDFLPLGWSPGPLPQGVMLARMNADNQQLLGAESSLDEVRVHEALKDESPALLHELQRLEFKLNVLLRITSDLARRSSNLPAPQHIKLAAVGMEWIGEDLPVGGATGVLDLYINTTLPQPLKLPATIISNVAHSGTAAAQMQFSGLSDQVVDLIEKLIFRHHRRLVAGARIAPKSA
jgi:Atypical PilZ domain, cyclic di-GMP receptor